MRRGKQRLIDSSWRRRSGGRHHPHARTRRSRQNRRPPSPSRNLEISATPRLQKVLAAAGFGSRRDCEDLILAGRVEVDRQVVAELGTRVDPQNQEIRVDGEPLKRPRLVYYAVHKPRDVISSHVDPAGRARVVDLVPPEPRVFAVGRLDVSSEGLMVVTNDGELAHRLTHPRFRVEKLYHVQVAGLMQPEELEPLKKGVHLAEGVARAARVQIRSQERHSTWLEMVLDEGKNRQIRRLLARVGHKVLRLRRVAIGSLRLGDLPPGAYRELTPLEVARLRESVAVELGKSKLKLRRRRQRRPPREDRPQHARGAARARRQRPAGAPAVALPTTGAAPASQLRQSAAPAARPSSGIKKSPTRRQELPE